MPSPPLIVGLTGSIGSGKSTVANFFHKLGVPIISADAISKQVVEPGEKAYDAIKERFGETVLHASQHLDRAKLRKKIFNSKKDKKWLEDLLHPLIRQEIIKQVHGVKNSYCIVEIPLLNNRENFPYLHRVLLVTADIASQIKRVAKRDNTHEASVEQILKQQLSNEKFASLADDIITNNTSLDDLSAGCIQLHHKYLSLCTNK